ncbi:MAG: hypothetical protein M3295_10055 [Chloroflexota bacterium]|nr:hypothetical protein [Chloroflexota bacterium]
MWYRTYERWDYAPAHGTGIGGAIYLLVGVIVAMVYNYFDHLTTLGRLLSALIAVLVWPLVLLGVHINIG